MNARLQAMGALAELGERKVRRAIDYVRLTEPQREFLSRPDAVKLWRGGNQLGKSFAVALEVVWTARGTHPFVRTRRPPVEVFVVSVSKDQMVPLHEKVWSLCPKDELDPSCGFDPGRGITGKPARLVFKSGPGAGSVIHFGTYEQGAKRLASGTLSLVVLDEPPPEQLFGEAVPRILRHHGRIVIGMTPTPDMPDVLWLKELVEADDDDVRINEFNCALTEANVWPAGSPMPFLTQAEINRFEARLLRVEREMRMRGAWEPIVLGAWLDHFIREDHVRDFGLADITRVAPDAITFVGYDHGTAPNKEAIVVGAAAGKRRHRAEMRVWSDPRLWFMHSKKLEGKAVPEVIVDTTLDMLREVGLSHDAIDVWVGDRAAYSRNRRSSVSNKDLEIAWAAKLNTQRSNLSFQIQPAYKPAGSVMEGMRLMNALLARRYDKGRTPAVLVHPRCEDLILSMAKHEGASKDPLKDVLDAGRYPTQRIIRAGEWMTDSLQIIAA